MQNIILKASSQQEYYFEEGCYITELSNSPHDPACSIARARVAPGVTTALHKLGSTIERYIILAGSGTVTVGELQQAVSPLDVVIIPPGYPQQIANTGEGDLVFLAICTPRFSPADYQELSPASGTGC